MIWVFEVKPLVVRDIDFEYRGLRGLKFKTTKMIPIVRPYFLSLTTNDQ